MAGNCDFGSCHLKVFSELYEPIHKPLSFVICVFGTIANILNIIVLSQKHMRTPTNVLLSGLSLAQLLLVANYIVLQSFLMCRENCCSGAVWTAAGAWFMYLNVNFNLVFHTVACTHTLVISMFRFVSVQWPTTARAMIQNKHPWKWSVFIFLLIPFLCIPVYLTATVSPRPENRSTCIDQSYDLEFANDPVLISAVFWLFGVLFKLIPCTLLAIFSGLLINSIRLANIRKQRLLEAKFVFAGAKEETGRTSLEVPLTVRSPRRNTTGQPVVRSRTTRMLIAIACCCFVVEFSHGIVNLLTAIYGTEFGIKVYNQLGDLFEMATLLYSSINFVLYCGMSNDFLRAFAKLFCPKPVHRALLVHSSGPINKSKKTGKTPAFYVPDDETHLGARHQERRLTAYCDQIDEELSVAEPRCSPPRNHTANSQLTVSTGLSSRRNTKSPQYLQV